MTGGINTWAELVKKGVLDHKMEVDEPLERSGRYEIYGPPRIREYLS